jgi:hypothetical protein
MYFSDEPCFCQMNLTKPVSIPYITILSSDLLADLGQRSGQETFLIFPLSCMKRKGLPIN